jgi:hypothetical protein
MLTKFGWIVAMAALPWAAAACPTDAAPRASGTLLTVEGAGPSALALDAATLASLPLTRLTQRLTVSSSASGAGPVEERNLGYAGVLLRDLLERAGLDATRDRGARVAVVEAVATDNYRAVFTWGELFNTTVGEQVLVVMSQDGKPLDAAAGPLALRSLADLRPGPRHVRNPCAIVVRR